MQKRRLLILMGLVSLCGDAGLAEAQVYRWTDEQGQVHYGDRVPESYRHEAKVFDLKASPSRGEIRHAMPVGGSKDSDARHVAPPSTVSRERKPPLLSGCQKSWLAYERPQACLGACGSDRSRFAGAGIGRRHDCACPNVAKPKCQI